MFGMECSPPTANSGIDNLPLKMLLVKLHVVYNPAAIVHGRVHPPVARVGPHVGRHIVSENRTRLVHFVGKPLADIQIFFALGQCSRQVRKHLKNEIPFKLEV